MESKSCSKEKEKKEMGLGVHSQVIRIKKETEKIKHPSLQHLQHMRRVLNIRDVNHRLRSRSPLGLADPDRPILLGNA